MVYEITMIEHAIHVFTIDVESGEDPKEVAKEIFLNNKRSDLADYGLINSICVVDDATPQ